MRMNAEVSKIFKKKTIQKFKKLLLVFKKIKIIRNKT